VTWFAGILAVLLTWWRQWLPVRRAVREARPLRLDTAYATGDLRVMASPAAFEPGVVGIWRSILLVPPGIFDRMTPAQVNAVIAHEQGHVRHRDNLVALVHMLVEAAFWFHPLVWWIGRRLLAERERGCDEDVVRAGHDPAEYAEGILAVCRLTVANPLACVAGVSGSDLRCRIESIFRDDLGRPPSARLRLALTLAAIASIAVPIAVAAVDAAPVLTIGQDPSEHVAFDVASIKVNRSGERPGRTDDSVPGAFSATNVWAGLLIRYAYGIQDNRIEGLPDWARTLAPERFDVSARLEPLLSRTPAADVEAKRLAMRTLLADRFHLVVTREMREVPMWALVLARSDGRLGPMLKRDSTDCSPAAIAARVAGSMSGASAPAFCGMRVNTGRIQFGGPLSSFASQFAPDGRSTVDRTGLTGNWQFVLTFTADQQPQAGQDPLPVDPNAPSLPVALQEQLGLKLEPTTGRVEVLVIERFDRPTEN
jgi:uncharacterized protein (TIGR03435 family)